MEIEDTDQVSWTAILDSAYKLVELSLVIVDGYTTKCVNCGVDQAGNLSDTCTECNAEGTLMDKEAGKE